MSWRPAKSITVFLGQVNTIYPGRSKASDGIIGDASHKKAQSDHNPNSKGVVCAIDITHDPKHLDIQDLADQLFKARDRRTKYVIANRKIFFGSAYTGSEPKWTWLKYTGTGDPHINHLHLSVGGNYDSTTKWDIGEEMPTEKNIRDYFNIIDKVPTKSQIAYYKKNGWPVLARDLIKSAKKQSIKPTTLKKGIYEVK